MEYRFWFATKELMEISFNRWKNKDMRTVHTFISAGPYKHYDGYIELVTKDELKEAWTLECFAHRCQLIEIEISGNWYTLKRSVLEIDWKLHHRGEELSLGDTVKFRNETQMYIGCELPYNGSLGLVFLEDDGGKVGAYIPESVNCEWRV